MHVFRCVRGIARGGGVNSAYWGGGGILGFPPSVSNPVNTSIGHSFIITAIQEELD